MSRKRLDPQREQRLRKVCEIVGHDFENLAILNRGLSHSSLGNEGLPDYERLEFLGDAVLGFLVAESLYKREPEILEGELTSRRSMMVSRRPLAIVASELDLGSYILVGRGLTDENLRSPRILADLVESVLAARDRSAAADSAPAAGLFLRRVFFTPAEMASYRETSVPFLQEN